ncbi:MAG TPA: hypothetical protein VGL10_01695 [Gammaproteobacteria bacterium]
MNLSTVKVFRSSHTVIIAVGVSMLLFIAAAIGGYITGGLTLLGRPVSALPYLRSSRLSIR